MSVTLILVNDFIQNTIKVNASKTFYTVHPTELFVVFFNGIVRVAVRFESGVACMIHIYIFVGLGMIEITIILYSVRLHAWEILCFAFSIM